MTAPDQPAAVTYRANQIRADLRRRRDEGRGEIETETSPKGAEK